MSLSKQVIKKDMKMKFHMDGCVNGHSFTVEGEGTGQPFEGKQTLKVRVIKGGPLPFSFDILSSCFCYGDRVFINYPADIPDIFKQAFPEGMSWERAMTFEDGGCATASAHISLIDGNCLMHESTFHGVNFPANGHAMLKKTLGWEPSTEKLTVHDGILKGDIVMILLLEGGGKHKCQFKTTYKTKKAVKMPQSHFVEVRLTSANLDGVGNTFQVDEIAVARGSTI